MRASGVLGAIPANLPLAYVAVKHLDTGHIDRVLALPHGVTAGLPEGFIQRKTADLWSTRWYTLRPAAADTGAPRTRRVSRWR